MINFDNEFGFIIVQKADFIFIRDYFFKEYIEKNICILQEIKEDLTYHYIYCDFDFKTEMKKFPDINFMIRDINYTFTLTYEDLFVEFNQKIFFMLVNELHHTYYWTLGNIFLIKFPFIFDYDKKTIIFININNISYSGKDFNHGNNFSLFFIGGICIFLSISFGVFIGKIIWDKNKKRRANELIDDYEYNINEENN